MSELKTAIQDQANVLRKLAAVHQKLSNSKIPTSTLDQWEKRIRLIRILEGTLPLLNVRIAAWVNVSGLSKLSQQANLSSNIVRFGETDVPFDIARHLALSAYVCSCWAIYDRLANYCGRIAGSPGLAEDVSSNPKLCGHLIDNGKKDCFGFACHSLIQDSYAWPIRVAYKIRNWIVHEGVEEGGIRMFAGDNPTDGFILHQSAKQHLQECGREDFVAGKFDKCRIEASDERWVTGNLAEILPIYHQEIDNMFGALVSWSTLGLESQIRLFAKRDL